MTLEILRDFELRKECFKMFEPIAGPRIFGVPPGADFPKALVNEILAVYKNRPPEDLARARILVNTRRMQRRLRSLFCKAGPLLLPKIALVTDFDQMLSGADLPAAVTPLRRKLEMTRLVAERIEFDQHAPRSAAVDLAESLAFLLDELHGEAVPPEKLSELKVEDESGYWERSLAFLRIVKTYVDQVSDERVDAEARRRAAVNMLIDRWQQSPPKDPVIVAGSTGSRGTTALLMKAVAKTENGAVVLPGFDFDLRQDVWNELMQARHLEDHPQYRFAAFLAKIGAARADVRQLGTAPDPDRNTLISLSLRPAKVTDQWLSEGPGLGDLTRPTSGLALMEAAQPKEEAVAIAVALKEAIHDGKKVALITPDGTLGRRVSAALARWNIRADESSGVPLSLTPPGRFLRHVANLINGPIRLDVLLSLLKHPYCNSGSDNRGSHILHTNAFEIFCRERYVAEVDRDALEQFAERADKDRVNWATWLADLLDEGHQAPAPKLNACLSHHIALAEAFAAGENGSPDLLWQREDGEDVIAQIESFRGEADFSAPVSFPEYARLIERALMAENSRPQQGVRPDVMIWGTLEARVQGADLVILGGLNEGTWPEQPAPDPWLSRTMRRDLGLLLPERQIGLSAHDYQQAVAAKEVILSRAKRNDEQETVPSRWLNRLVNLLKGLKENQGPEALQAMQDKGNRFILMAATLDPSELAMPAKRPAPSPPVNARPKTLSVTAVRTLVRDPYAIYAKEVLRLKPLSPLFPKADPRLKGIVFHAVMEKLFRPGARSLTGEQIKTVTAALLERHVPWPHVRAHWMGHLSEICDQLIAFQADWAARGEILKVEAEGMYGVPGTRFNIKGTADRIDRARDGSLVIFDYKTGKIPTKKEIKIFDRQLSIEAVMAEAGVFKGVPPTPVSGLHHVGIGRTPSQQSIDLEKDTDLVTIPKELATLLLRYDSEEQGYISRRIMEKSKFGGDYDHLARFGEWDETQSSVAERVR
ncbi:MAG: double-strand break repair protein AddB [Silicimonas sp.]|nr:double-strand break repair protein AddB [Silicimonas sp.]